MNMDTLIALGTLTAYVFSAAQIAANPRAGDYFDTAAVILAAIEAGRFFEERASARPSTWPPRRIPSDLRSASA
jgi:cation-transporting ATPase V